MRPVSPTIRRSFGRRAARALLGCCAALSALAPLGAQQVFRSVDAQGRPVFSDRDLGREARDAGIAATRTDAASFSRIALPYELRQVAQRFPVTFYSSPDCGTPCDAARQLLTERGIPHTEHTVSTAEDVQALKRLSGKASLPFATIGRQPLDGFSAVEWNQYLDAAQYPKRSELPAGYRQPAPTPLVAVAPARAARPADAAAPSPAAPSQTPNGNPPANPAGIRF
jgi:glutaredoxin